VVEPVRWTGAQLGGDASCGKERFRIERLKEPLELYTEFFDTFVSIFDRLIDQIEKLTEPDLASEVLAEVMATSRECLSTPTQRHAACAYGPCAPCRMA